MCPDCATAFAVVVRPITHELVSHGLWFEWCRKSLQILKLFAALHIFLACKNSCFYICGCQVSTCLLMPGPCFTGLLPVCIGMYNLLLQVATRSLQLHFHIGPIITGGGHPYVTSAHFWTLLDPPIMSVPKGMCKLQYALERCTISDVCSADWQKKDSAFLSSIAFL